MDGNRHEPTGPPKYEIFSPYGQFAGIWLPEALVRFKRIGWPAKILYARLAKYGGRSGIAFPKQSTLAAEMDVSERSIQMYIKELVDAHLITVTQRGLNKPNTYRFLKHPEIFDTKPVYDPQDFAGPDAKEAEIGPDTFFGSDPQPLAAQDPKNLAGPYSLIKSQFKESVGRQEDSSTTAAQCSLVDARGREEIEDPEPDDDDEPMPWEDVPKQQPPPKPKPPGKPPTAPPSGKLAAPNNRTRQEKEKIPYPQTARAVRQFFPAADGHFIDTLAARARKAVPDTTDADIAEAVRRSYHTSQRKAGLFLVTVPDYLLNRSLPPPLDEGTVHYPNL